jgi:hypothetical protein
MTRHTLAATLITLTAGLSVAVAGSKDKDAKPPKAESVVIDDKLAASDPKDAKLKDSAAKRHKLKLQAGVTYVIDLTSKDFDAYLRLEDTDGQPLAEDDDGGGGTNARLFFIPRTTGEYTIVATAYRPKLGKYHLTAQQAHLPSTALKLEAGAASVKDKLAVTGSRSPFSPHNSCKIYRVELKADTTYRVDLDSSDFDAYLVLSDDRLLVLGRDDDKGGKSNSLLRFECKQDGAYYLVASGLGQPLGAFELKIRAAD